MEFAVNAAALRCVHARRAGPGSSPILKELS